MATLELHPLTERILSGKAPEAICLAAARGALPVPAEDLLRARVWLAENGSEAIATACREAVRDQAVAEVAPLLAHESCSPEVLSFVARLRAGDEELMAPLVHNPVTRDDTLVELASTASAEVLERLVENQQRLLGCPELVRALAANPDLPVPARTRLEDILAELQRRERREMQATVPRPAPVEPEPAPEPLESIDDGAAPAPEPAVEEALEEKEEEEASEDLIIRIMNMAMPDKIKLAFKGGREERSILIRDTNQSVALGVLRSPKVTESEVETFAAMRNVVDEVLRLISESREWTKSYAVVHALCKNPKAPVRKSISFMSRLNNRDLRLLGMDRGVPEAVRVTAKRFYVARTSTKVKRPGKK